MAALLTLVHFFRPNVFKLTGEDPAYRDRLAAGLFKRSGGPEGEEVVSPAPFRAAVVNPGGAVKKGEGRFEVIVEEAPPGLRAFVERDGKRIGNLPSDRTLPAEIAYLVRSGYRQEMSLSLFAFLNRAENRYPIYYADGPRKTRIAWLGEVRCATWTELDVQGR